MEVFADDVVDFDAVEVKQDCYGDEYHSIRTFGVSWNSSDSEVTTVNSSGTATALNGGESDIEASFSGRIYYNQECFPQYGPEKEDATGKIQPNIPGCGGCSNQLRQQRPKGRLRVKPKITSITPTRGLIGNQTSVTINGRGFGSNPTVLIGGTGVTYSGGGGSATQLTGTMNATADATTGNHAVQVANKGQKSNSVNFFVIPFAFKAISVTQTNGNCDPGLSGFAAEVVYEVVDDEFQPLAKSGLTPEEIFSVDGDLVFPNYKFFADPPTTNSMGRFNDRPIVTCSNAPGTNPCFDVRQQFRIRVPSSGGGELLYFLGTETNRRDCRLGIKVTVTTGVNTQTFTLGTVN